MPGSMGYFVQASIHFFLNGGRSFIFGRLEQALVAVYGKTVSVIGAPTQLKLAIDAIESLLSGSMHGYVYKKIEFARRQEKFARLQLWENQDVF